MAPYAEISATIRGNAYAELGEQKINGVSFLADDVDLTAKPVEQFTISIADQNRQPIEGTVIDLSFDATWTVVYKDASGETAATLIVKVGDGGKVTTPEIMTGNVTILYATSVGGQVASEMPVYAFDGDDSTKWCPGGNATTAELSIDVGAWYSLTEVNLIHAGHRESGRNTVDFDLQVLKATNPTAEELASTAYLTNDDNWVTIASYRNNTDNRTDITFDAPIVGRYFRLDVIKGDKSAQWPSTRIYEWSMTGVPTDAPGEPHEHVYEAVVTAPTCTEGGYTTYTCACGDTYIADETEALGHDWKGTSCTRCDAKRENPFTDVPEGSFYIDPVLWAVEKGITTGATATTFNPNGDCQRAAVVTFLWRAAGSPEPTKTENPFTDVKESDFYYKAVLWAVEKGVTNGLTADTFGPFALCNRAQVVTFLWRAMGSPASTADVAFTDVVPGQFYSTAVAWAVENNITNGISATEFGVGGICNRAQVVTFLYRTYVK